MASMRRLARIAAVAMITAGTVLLADVAATLLWKEPLSAAYAAIRQAQASDELDAVSASFIDDPEVADLRDRDAAGSRQAEQLADLFSERLRDGQPIGRISIPAIDAEHVVIQGTDEADLKLGPGHYPESALPGQGRTVAIAGHRTTYGAPFNRIDDIDVGDPITMEMPYGRFSYEVTKTKIVDPTDTEIVEDRGRDRLVLTSCHPLYSAAQRYAITADLSKFELDLP